MKADGLRKQPAKKDVCLGCLGEIVLRPSLHRKIALSAVPAEQREHCACVLRVSDQRKLLSLIHAN